MKQVSVNVDIRQGHLRGVAHIDINSETTNIDSGVTIDISNPGGHRGLSRRLDFVVFAAADKQQGRKQDSRYDFEFEGHDPLSFL